MYSPHFVHLDDQLGNIFSQKIARLLFAHKFHFCTSLHINSQMPLVPALISADCTLGRPDIFSLPDQDCMELFVQRILDNPRVNKDLPDFFDDLGHFTDACAWDCVTCSESGNIRDVMLECEEWVMGSHSVRFTLLPRGLNSFWLNQCYVLGSLDFAALPDGLTDLLIIGSACEGSICMRDMPQPLQYLVLHDCDFSGTVSWVEIPRGLKKLD